jgi:outer membrane protein TolC
MNGTSRPLPLATAIAAALLLAGCTVTPQPMDDSARRARMDADLALLYAGQDEVQGPITLQQAIARGMKYNLEHRVRLMEETLAAGALEVARFDMWPQLVANAGYLGRSNEAGAESESLETGQISLEASTSEEENRGIAGLGFSWNLLDFGVSYATAQQQADQVLIAGELRRKAAQNLVVEIQVAWWRAAVGEQSLREIEALIAETAGALENSRKSIEGGLKPPLEALGNQKKLLELVNRLTQLRKEVRQAKHALATLMNLRPGTPYTVAATEEGPLPPLPETAVAELEAQALAARPELREEDYRKRISTQEARKALLRMLPGLELNFGYTNDSNKYLYNNDWADAGLQLSWNIFNLISGPKAREYADRQVELADLRRQALSAAVIAQVHLSVQRYAEAVEDYRNAAELDDVESRIAGQVSAQRVAEKADQAQEVMSRASALGARLRRGLAYAEVQSARARIEHTLGADPAAPAVVAAGAGHAGDSLAPPQPPAPQLVTNR